MARLGRRARTTLLFVVATVAGLAPLTARQTPPQAATRQQLPGVGGGTSTISGVVTDATTGRPIAGALVSLTPIAGRIAGAGIRQVTDGTGRFAFTRLSAGDGYQINASQFGYLDGGFGRSSPESTTRLIVLQDGEWFRDAQITLWRPATVSGTIRDETGEPIVGIIVNLVARITIAGQPQLAAGPFARTDDRGEYRIANLRPGTYSVVVPSVQTAVPAATSPLTLSGLTPETLAQAEAAGRTGVIRQDPSLPLDPANRLLLGPYAAPPPAAVNGRPQAYPVTFYPSARTIAEASSFDLRYGDDRQGIDVHLAPVPVVRVSGRVDGPADELARLTARLMPAGGEALGTGSEAATALVAPDGSFTFLNVPDGRYSILLGRAVSELTVSQRAGGSGFPVPPGEARGGLGSGSSAVLSGPAGTNLTTRVGRGGSAYAGRVAVDVGDRDLTGVQVRLERGATLSGQLVQEGAPAGTGRGGGRGLVIQAEPAAGDPTLGLPRATTVADGATSTFTIEGLRTGQYLLRLLNATSIKSITWDGKDYTSTPFDASAGRDISGVVITTTTAVATIRGTVRQQNGTPRTNAAVIYFPQEREQWTRYGLQPPRLRSVPVTSTGTYEISRAPAGRYFLVAVDEARADGWKTPAFLEAAAQVAARVSVEWGETTSQDLVVEQVVTK